MRLIVYLDGRKNCRFRVAEQMSVGTVIVHSEAALAGSSSRYGEARNPDLALQPHGEGENEIISLGSFSAVKKDPWIA